MNRTVTSLNGQIRRLIDRGVLSATPTKVRERLHIQQFFEMREKGMSARAAMRALGYRSNCLHRKLAKLGHVIVQSDRRSEWGETLRLYHEGLELDEIALRQKRSVSTISYRLKAMRGSSETFGNLRPFSRRRSKRHS